MNKPAKSVPGRADTFPKKRTVVETIAIVWATKFPEQRFGQLLFNAINEDVPRDIFYVEDEELIRLVKAFANKYRGDET